MAIQDDKTILNKGDLKAYHQKILPYLGGNMMVSTNKSDFYSTDEKVVGVWTDGKPVYQKTYVLALNKDYATLSTSIEMFDTDTTKKAIDVTGTYEDKSGRINLINFWNFNVGTSSTPMYCSWCYNFIPAGLTNAGHAIMYKGGISTNNVKEMIITMKYIKTTDTAGSATTTPGAYDINFPNTWAVDKEIYFGNGLYGYRQIRTTPSAPSTKYTIITGVKRIISYGGTEFRNGDGYGHPIGCSPGASSGNAYPYLYIEGATMTSGTGTLSMWGADTGMKGWDVWVTYTK